MSDVRPRSKYREPRQRSVWPAVSAILLLLSMATAVIFPLITKRGFNELCSSSAECRRGLCHIAPFGMIPTGYCTYRCSRDGHCPEGFFCPPEAGGVCVPNGDARFGTMCSEHYDCASRLCVQVTRKYRFSVADLERRAPLLFNTAYCGAPCPVTGTCEDGTECLEVEGLNARVCMPNMTIEEDIKRNAKGFQEVGTVPLFTQPPAQSGDGKASSSKTYELESTQHSP